MLLVCISPLDEYTSIVQEGMHEKLGIPLASIGPQVFFAHTQAVASRTHRDNGLASVSDRGSHVRSIFAASNLCCQQLHPKGELLLL